MCTSEAEIGIVVQLVGDGGLRAMASIDDGLGREGCHDMVQALLHLLPAALGKVGTTDAHAEQRVAGEYGMLLFAIEEAGAVGMAGCLEHLQRMGAEGDGIVLPEKTGYGGLLAADGLNTHEEARLLGHVFNQQGILSAHLNL